MKCNKIKRLMPDFIEGQLIPKLRSEVLEHLKVCENCARENRLYEESWQLIGQWKDIDPEPGFKTRFWNRLASQTETPLRWPFANALLLPRPLAVVLATAALLIVIAGAILPKYLQSKSAEQLALQISEEEVVLVENIDLLENLEVIQDIDFLENMEIIENLHTLDRA